MLPCAIRRRSASGVHVDELDLVRSADNVVRQRLPLQHAGDALDDVVHRFEVLNVHRRDDVDPGVEKLLDILPALLVLRSRHVRVRELVDEHLGGCRRRIASMSISSNSRPAVTDLLARDDLEAFELFGRVHASVGLDETDDDIGAATRGAGALRSASRRSCRRRERRRE